MNQRRKIYQEKMLSYLIDLAFDFIEFIFWRKKASRDLNFRSFVYPYINKQRNHYKCTIFCFQGSCIQLYNDHNRYPQNGWQYQQGHKQDFW